MTTSKKKATLRARKLPLEAFEDPLSAIACLLSDMVKFRQTLNAVLNGANLRRKLYEPNSTNRALLERISEAVNLASHGVDALHADLQKHEPEMRSLWQELEGLLDQLDSEQLQLVPRDQKKICQSLAIDGDGIPELFNSDRREPAEAWAHGDQCQL